MLRVVLIFLHVMGAIGVFAALAIEGAVLLQIRRAADGAQLRTALEPYALVPRVAMPSLGVTLLTGIYLTATVWGWHAAWIDVAFLGVITTAAIGATMTRSSMTRLTRSLSLDDAHDPMLWASFVMRAFMLIGIVFLMTVKPPLYESLIAMMTAAGAGMLAAWRRVRSSASSVVSA